MHWDQELETNDTGMNDEECAGRPLCRLGFSEKKVRLTNREDWDRRLAIRFPLAMGIRFSVQQPRGRQSETGVGQTVDLSSSGLRFRSERPPEPGAKVHLSLDWPVVLDDGVQLQLTISGTVVRTNGCDAALQIARHDFKTRRRGL